MTNAGNRPHKRPTCKHGHSIGSTYGCRECCLESEQIRKAVAPLEELFWKHKGRNSGELDHLLHRAYRMGMKHEENHKETTGDS